MTVRQTSIKCYHEIKANGLLSVKRLQVYSAILNNAPCSSSEAMVGNLNSTNVLSQSRARFTELRDLGVIYEKGTKICSITGRNVIEWDLTDRLPVKTFNTNKTKKQRVDNSLIALRRLYKIRYVSVMDDWIKVADLIKSI